MPKFPVNNLKQIRKKKGIGQSELANAVGVSKQLLSGFENQRSGISNTVISKIAIFLNIPIEKIVSHGSSDTFSKKEIEKLTMVMDVVSSNYGDNFDKDTTIKIGAELYNLISRHEEANEDGKKEIFDSLEDKMIIGLAAKCMIKYIKN
jgi:transcriptional regulator with XRE-family HTH domain